MADSHYFYYAWALAGARTPVTGKGQCPLLPFYMEITPLAGKLTFAIQACQQFQAIEQAREVMSRAKDEAEAAKPKATS